MKRTTGANVLIKTVFCTEGLPAADRFDIWSSQIRTDAIWKLCSDHRPDFRVSRQILGAGAVSMSAFSATMPAMLVRRARKLIKSSAPEAVHLLVHGVGGRRFSIGKDDVVCGPHDWSVADFSRPYDMRTEEGRHTSVGFVLPKALLPLPQNRITQMIGQRLPGQSGYGALLTQLLTQILKDTSSYGPDDVPQLETMVVDLLTALFCRALDSNRSVPLETQRRNLILRIRAFVRQNLHDPELSPSTVAAAHNVSLSHLYSLFKEEGETIAAWIRGQRLERARRDLADPAIRNTPIHTIAARWGFTRPGDFSRAFRTAYGIPPNDYRHQSFSASQKPR